MTGAVGWLAWITGLGVSLAASSAIGQSAIYVWPYLSDISVGAYGEVYYVERLGIGVAFGPNAQVKFKLDRVVPIHGVPNCFVVSPSSGVTPTIVTVGPNQNVTRSMLPGQCAASLVFTTVDQSPPATAQAAVRLTVKRPPPTAVGAVVNTASLQPVISPGGLISIYGENLGPPVLSAEYDGEGLYPTTFGNITVTINDIAAPLLYVSPSRIDAVVPYALAGQESARIVVSRYREKSPTFDVAVSAASPALFTADSSGTGPGAILEFKYPDFIPNSTDNPASPGSVVVLFATGTGILDETTPEASICMNDTPYRAQPVSLTIGGLPANIRYVGTAPYQTVRSPGFGSALSPGTGGVSYQTIAKLLINAVVPDGLPSGPQPVVLTIGTASNEEQRVTIAIK